MTPRGDDIDGVLHELRNAINVMVTAGRCLQEHQGDAASSDAFARALEGGADDARLLLDRLQLLVRERRD